MKAILLSTIAFATAAVGADDDKTKRPTAKEILAKHIEAVGGIEAQKKLSTRKIEGHVTMAQVGAPWKVAVTQKAPDKKHVRTEIAEGTVVEEAAAGGVAWKKDPGAAPRKLEGEELRAKLHDARFFGMIEMIEQGEFSYEGRKDLDGSLCHALKATFGEGSLWGDTKPMLFFDAKTHMLKQMTMPVGNTGLELVFEIKMGDYRKVDGLPYPHSYVMRIDSKPFMTMEFEKVTHDIEVDDELFAMPKE